MKYKMILLDMDGTLLDDNKNIQTDNVRVLQTLQSKGVIIGIATGRRYSFAKPVLERYGLKAVFFSNNGNTTWDMQSDRLLDCTTLKKDHFLNVLKLGYEEGMHPILHVNLYDKGYDLATEFDYTFEGYKGYIRKDTGNHLVDSDLTKLADSVMIMCYGGDLDKVRTLQTKIHALYSDDIHTHITMSLIRIGPLLEISEKEGTKWHAAIKYATGLGIKQNEIVAIGDDNNDIEMIEHAGVGIAMKNALDGAKNKADIILEYDNNQAGVAKGLEIVYGDFLK